MPAALPDLFQAICGEARVALAVSGGSDSMALLRLAHERAGLKFSVLTVDHGLRAAASAEAQQVAAWSAALGAEHHTLRWLGQKPVAGIQAGARKARYDLMTAWCRAHGATALLTAHTMDDQAETVLMRMARTSSPDSLAGIAPLGQWGGIRLVRPLLVARREALRGYLRGLGQAWIEDPSNDDRRFERVRVRGMLRRIGSSDAAAERLAALADECREAVSALQAAADGFAATEVRSFVQGYGTCGAAALLALPAAIRVRVLKMLIGRFGGGAVPERAELLRLAADMEAPGARRTLGGAVLWRRSRDILVAREAGRIAADPLSIPGPEPVLWDGRFEITAPAGSEVVPARLFPRLARPEGLPHVVGQSLPVIRGPEGTAAHAAYAGSARFSARFHPARTP